MGSRVGGLASKVFSLQVKGLRLLEVLAASHGAGGGGGAFRAKEVVARATTQRL